MRVQFILVSHTIYCSEDMFARTHSKLEISTELRALYQKNKKFLQNVFYSARIKESLDTKFNSSSELVLFKNNLLKISFFLKQC